MITKQLEAQMEVAFNEHATALETGNTQHIQAAWNRYARAKNDYMEAFYGGEE